MPLRFDDLKKDPNIFKHYAPELGAMAREETLRVAEDIVFERDADMREFLTTRRTFVTGRLAAIYNVLPPPRRSRQLSCRNRAHVWDFQPGFFLAAHAHPVSTSLRSAACSSGKNFGRAVTTQIYGHTGSERRSAALNSV